MVLQRVIDISPQFSDMFDKQQRHRHQNQVEQVGDDQIQTTLFLSCLVYEYWIKMLLPQRVVLGEESIEHNHTEGEDGDFQQKTNRYMDGVTKGHFRIDSFGKKNWIGIISTRRRRNSR